jgi:hypothetical protein
LSEDDTEFGDIITQPSNLSVDVALLEKVHDPNGDGTGCVKADSALNYTYDFE